MTRRTARTLIFGLTSIVVVVGAGCARHEAELAAAALEPVRVSVEPVSALTQTRQIEVYGIVQPARQAVVSSRVVGPVVAVDVRSSERVKKDQILLRIQPQAVDGQLSQAQGALAQAQAALALAERNFKRYEALHGEKAASDLELDMARMQLEQARGATRQAEGAVESASAVADDATVRAPFPARVVDTLVEVGDLAAPGRPLVSVESLEGSEIWLNVRAADIHRVSTGQSLEVRLDARSDLGVLVAKVREIVPSADPATHTFLVKASLEGSDILSGLSGHASLPGDTTEVLSVPASSVHRRGGLELVVVRGEDSTARTRAVTTGRSLAGDRIEILSGISASDQVVVDAPGPVADGTPLEVVS